MLTCRAGKSRNAVFFVPALLPVLSQLPAAREKGEGGAASPVTQRRPAHSMLRVAVASVSINYEPTTLNVAVVSLRAVTESIGLETCTSRPQILCRCSLPHVARQHRSFSALACGFVSACKAHPTLLQDFYEHLVGYIADSDEVNDTNFSNAGHDPAGASSALAPGGNAQMEGVPKMVSQARFLQNALSSECAPSVSLHLIDVI